MAENEDGTERTEQPTQRRLQQARDRGQVPQSKELGNAVMIGAATLSLLALSGGIGRSAVAWMQEALSWRELPPLEALPALFGLRLWGLFKVVAPLIGIGLLAAFVAPTVMGGLRFSSKSLVPSFNRLDPMKNVKQLYGREALVELVRSVLRVLLIALFAGAALRFALPELLALVHQPLGAAAAGGFWLVLQVLLALAGALVVLAAIDAPYQAWSYRQQLMMTRQEVREEMKETEGSPEIKARIRRTQMQISQRRMMQDVPTADVILVNPTHYAVALRYDAGNMRAPRVVAKGVDLVAQAIRELGESHKVPIVSAPPLARALYRQTQIGEEIPVALYAAVAQILGYVYQLRTWRRDGGAPPAPPSVDVPEGLEPRDGEA